MIIYSNSKINIGLNIVGKRPDGYHDLNTIFYPIPLSDIIEIIESSVFKFKKYGINSYSTINNNLCVKAYKMLKKDFKLPNVEIYLYKSIPAQAGLGGGSSNATFTLSLLNKIFGLELTSEMLHNYALKLGSDCPFFIKNVPIYAEGRGELFTTIDLSLKGKTIILVKPLYGISTKIAFEGVKFSEPKISLKDIYSIPLSEWKNYIKNDFEKNIFAYKPEMKKIKDKLYYAGAVYASMSGSGSAIYGLFENHDVNTSEFEKKYFVWKGILN